MKISEKLSILKQKEGELIRSYDMRDSVFKQSFKDILIKTDEMTDTDLTNKQKEFVESKKLKIKTFDSKIDVLKEEIIAGRNEINKANVEVGLDKKLIEMKYLKLELAKLMKLVKSDRFSLRNELYDMDLIDELGISDRIKELEIKKTKLDSQIQHSNWSHELQSSEDDQPKQEDQPTGDTQEDDAVEAGSPDSSKDVIESPNNSLAD